MESKGRMQAVAALEVAIGALFIFFRKEMRNKRVDKEGIVGLVFGSLVLIYGQTLWTLAFRQKTPPVGMIIFVKFMLCACSLFYAISLMHEKKTVMVSVFLVVYALLGMPFAAVVHNSARNAYLHDPRMGELTASERAAAMADRAEQRSNQVPGSRGFR
eukprot:TRINITY_DN1264_c1_g1_i1.p1 TRINITY_DN1264_c1_g1~~TRINITY_DN1264_c1_g1_i1.p1  ORF type:complete len:184 (-),score=25.17 TRINITY_DN1264_c1_g1_i1:140-616(-)